MKIRKNDMVLVVSGNQKGKKGKVLKVFPKEKRIIVEGVRLIKRHSKPTQKNPKGGIVEKEASINVSNVMVICSKCDTATRVGIKTLEDRRKTRVCKSCGEMILST